MTLMEQVKIEALAHGRRLNCARQLSATIKGPSDCAYGVGDRIRAIADQLDAADQEARRREALARLAHPSALIAAMKRDWPGQAAAVKRLADRLGIPLGEAWARTIAAGVAAIQRRGVK